jgi:hypothetical protein
MEQLNNQNPSQEETLVLVNNMPFPEAIVGDKVKQYGYWFELTETSWVISSDPAQGDNP